MSQKRVGILRGGTGDNYRTSLRLGGGALVHILENLSELYKPVDILLDRDGQWHVSGIPVALAELMYKVDLVWNMAHPGLTLTLSDFAIPTVGGSYFSHSLENSKDMLRKHMKSMNIPMARSVILPVYQEDFDGPRQVYAIKKAKEVFGKFGSPWIVKSFTPNKDMAVHLAKTFDELVGAIEDGVKNKKSILVEEFIEGKIASTHTVAGFRRVTAKKEDIYILPMSDTHGQLSSLEKESLTSLTKSLYNHLGAGYYLKANFIMNKRGKVYLDSIESMPDLRPGSQLALACESAGLKTHHIVEHMLESVYS